MSNQREREQSDFVILSEPKILHLVQKIMMMVGLDSLESLHRCRQVCTAWNSMIMQNIWESPSIIKMRIEKNLAPGISEESGVI